MPGGTLPLIGNNAYCQTLVATITPPASVAGGAAATATQTIRGLRVGDVVGIYPQVAIPFNMSPDSVWVSANDVLSISWSNASSSTSSSTPTAVQCIVLVISPSNAYAGVANYPTNV